MGNSTITLQKIMDGVSAIGDLNPVFNNTGGWADEPALTIGNDVMSELISIRFPWKWNRVRIPPFALTTYQQDYSSPVTGLGWLENGSRVDINNSSYPPPTWPIYVVRDLEASNVMGGWPYQVCWFYNRDLQQGVWPGPSIIYTQPIGANTAPSNPLTNITDVYGNILVLVKYGITGLLPPVATYPPINPSDPLSPPDYTADVSGQIIPDGTCEWLIVSPDAQGFRVNPRPPQAGQVWLIRLFGQQTATLFTKLNQLINPIPDDQAKWFRDGCVAYAHRYSSNPKVKALFEPMKADWFGAMELATKQNDREDESKGFFPDKSVMAPSYTTDPGPWPYRYGWR
jgi:hypothetical protein